MTKELKLTFAKAEHLKRNARQAEDPKLGFQAMRPVFNDMVTEVQRSIGYFQGIARKAKIGGVVILGNAVKLPGLRQYLGKNLGYEVSDFDSFSKLTGSTVASRILGDWDRELTRFVKVMPTDYKRVLEQMQSSEVLNAAAS